MAARRCACVLANARFYAWRRTKMGSLSGFTIPAVISATNCDATPEFWLVRREENQSSCGERTRMERYWNNSTSWKHRDGRGAQGPRSSAARRRKPFTIRFHGWPRPVAIFVCTLSKPTTGCWQGRSA